MGTGRRAGLLTTLIGVAVLGVACGRASDAEIFQAIGITPTPTQSAEEIATATAAVAARQTAVAAAAASPGGSTLALGDITRGGRTFNSNCVQCHSAGGSGGDILSPGTAGSGMTLEALTTLVREAPNHTPPGPYQSFQITDRALNDLAAYIAAEAGT